MFLNAPTTTAAAGGSGGCKNYRDPVVRKEARGSMAQLYFTCVFVFLGSIIICQLNKLHPLRQRPNHFQTESSIPDEV